MSEIVHFGKSRAMITISALIMCALPAGCTDTDAQAKSLLHPMFQDHAVLQRDRPVDVWGSAAPGADVTISITGVKARATAQADGRWQAQLPSLKAGGPFSLTATSSDGARQTVRDVLIGDVWLCSGQSNMELPVRRTLDADTEIRNSANDRIRLLKVAHATSVTPLTEFPEPVAWAPASPDTVTEFSAACFYFARELLKKVDVPMGLIHASWGGSRIETWMSQDALRAVGGREAALDVLKRFATDRPAAARRWGALWEEWWRSSEPASDGPAPWEPDFQKDDWRPAPGLGFWDNWGDPALSGFTGMVWYRTDFELTARQSAQKATLVLGAVDEIDQTWVNGNPVGGGSGGVRSYELPVGTLRTGLNSIVVNVLNTYKLGGLIGPAEAQQIRLQDGTAVPLSGRWFYRQVPASYGGPPRPPWDARAGLGMTHNAMITPIGPYGIRGALWYQGESNTSEAASYEALLSGLIADWRRIFGADLPFLIVQLAAFGQPPTEPGESGWAELREAQRRVAAGDDRAGLAVAIDIGDRYDIHPPNKQAVGRRLARAARKVVYGEPLAPSGPVVVSARRKGRSIVVTYADVEKGLVAYGADGPIGFEICSSGPETCRYADARIEGRQVRLTVRDSSAATRIRYCWADGPVCTLFDGSGLPAGPFELPVGPPPQ